MGAAKVPRPMRGICFPSSRTTKCHGCFYPTGEPAELLCPTLNGLRLMAMDFD